MRFFATAVLFILASITLAAQQPSTKPAPAATKPAQEVKQAIAEQKPIQVPCATLQRRVHNVEMLVLVLAMNDKLWPDAQHRRVQSASVQNVQQNSPASATGTVQQVLLK